jgi:hypothetical protein
MSTLKLWRALATTAFLVIVGVVIHQQLQRTRLEVDYRGLRANNAKLLLRSSPKLPARLTDEEFRLVLESLETREGVDVLSESSVSPSSLWPVNTAALKRVE